MRVLFVTHNISRYPGDMAGSFVLRLAVALQSQGIEVEVIAPASTDRTGDDVVEGIAIHRVRYAAPHRMTLAYSGTMAEAVRGSWGARIAFLGLFRALRSATLHYVDKAARDGRPFDVIHAHWWFPAGVSVWLASRTRRSLPPYIVTMHGSDVRLAINKTFIHPLFRAVLRRAAICTAVSGWLAQSAGQIVGADVLVAPMPVDTNMFEPRSQDVVGSRRSGILFVGRLNAQKGLADLIDALALIPAVHVDVVGDGPDKDILVARASSRGVDDRITWHGKLSQQELLPFYRDAAAVAMPSREEGLGLVAVEAQLSGTPVVAYASGGLPDVVLPDAGGTLVPVGDVHTLATSLASLTNDPALSKAKGTLARHAMLHRFAPDTVAAGYEKLYEHMVRQRATP